MTARVIFADCATIHEGAIKGRSSGLRVIVRFRLPGRKNPVALWKHPLRLRRWVRRGISPRSLFSGDTAGTFYRFTCPLW